MKIGIPKEIKNNENRVGMTPAGVAEFIRHGHEVMVQHTAGENSGFADEAYEKVGAIILPDIQSVYREAEMIVKVKEPIAENIHLSIKTSLYSLISILPVTRNLPMPCSRVVLSVWLTRLWRQITTICLYSFR